MKSEPENKVLKRTLNGAIIVILSLTIVLLACMMESCKESQMQDDIEKIIDRLEKE